MALKRSTVGRVTVTDTTDKTYDVRNISVEVGANVAPSVHSGLRENTGVLVSSAVEQMVRFDMGLDQALTVFGLGVTEYGSADTAEFVLGNVTGGTIDSGSTHTQWEKGASCLASCYIDSFQVSEGSEAVATLIMKYWSANGSTAPLTATGSVAFPALTAVPEIHTIGPVTINSTQIEGVTGISYQSGISIPGIATDGLVYAQGGYPTSFDRRISVDIADPVAIEAALSDIGAKIASTTTVVLWKSANDIPSATGAITLTIAAGFVHPRTFSGDHGGQVTGGLEIVPTSSDGTTVGIAVS